MSRFIIMPSIKTFDLIPIDRENTKRVIEISDAIVVDMGVFHRVEDQDNLKSLLCKLSRAGISRSSKGQIKIDGAYFDNYEDGVVSCCDGNFNEKYNELYSLLKYYNITFFKNLAFHFSIKALVSELKLNMALPYNVVIVGSNAETPAEFSTQLDPVKLNQSMGMAIKSFYHGSINNITSKNNKMSFSVNVNGLQGVNADWRTETLELEEGNYSSNLAILKAMALTFKETFGTGDGIVRKRKPRLVKPVNPPKIEIEVNELDDDGNGFISFSVKHMILSLGGDSPCSVFMKNDFILRGDDSVKVRNIDYSKTIQPTFLYCNIVENSYINGKLSRNLSTIPLSMKAGLNFYEFSNPAYVPIDVKEFSKIIIQLRDMDGKTIQFDPDYRTIINLHIKPINTAPQ